MMKPETKHPREAVLPVAERILARLAPACNQAVIAGSLRREKPLIKDIEICLLPIFATFEDLFGGMPATTEQYPALDRVIAELLADGTLRWDEEQRRNGQGWKRLLVPEIDVVCELFIADDTNFGDILAIRTGSAAYSKWFMTPRRFDGSLPDDMVHDGGKLYRFSSVAAAFNYRNAKAKAQPATSLRARLRQATLIGCKTENDFFAAIRTPLLAPRLRERTL